MLRKVIKDSAGKVIHIGDWDFRMEPVFEADLEKPIYQDDHEKPIYKGLFRKKSAGFEQVLVGYEQKQVGERATNPFPDGATESTADVVEGPDGGLYPVDDHVALRVQAYPSIGDQLEALFKAGLFPPEMATRIQAVKDQFPKKSK